MPALKTGVPFNNATLLLNAVSGTQLTVRACWELGVAVKGWRG